jgi:hypothetical protein
MLGFFDAQREPSWAKRGKMKGDDVLPLPLSKELSL